MKLELTPNPNKLAMRLLETMAEHGKEKHTLKEWCDMANIPCKSGYLGMAHAYARYFGLHLVRYDENGTCSFELIDNHIFISRWDY